MPTDTKNLTNLADGNYYLTQDLTITAISSLTGKKLTICLNGYDINTTAGAVFGYTKAGSVINFCDCSGAKNAEGVWTWGGTVTANRTGNARDFGGVINLQANAIMNVYGGNFVGALGGKASNGGIFNVCNDSYTTAGGSSTSDSSLYTKLSIYNGHFTGGTMTQTNPNVKSNGGIINCWHTVSVGIYGGTFVGGSAPIKGNFGFSSNNRITLENCTIIGGEPGIVMVMDSQGYVSCYNTLADALKNVKFTQYIRLTGDITEAVTIPDGVLIDLAGNNLSGVTVSDGAIFMDSTTDGYNGSVAGTLTPASGTISDTYKTSDTQAGAVKRYLTIFENGSYAFHRYYMAITKLNLKPGTAGMGYKATFVGSDAVKAHLSNTTAYGYKMWLSEDNVITRGYPASRFGGEQELTLRIDNFLDSTLDAATNEKRANMKLSACTYIRLADGSVIQTDPVCYTFREMLELANTNYGSYSTSQQAALQTLSAKFSTTMLSWDVDRIHHANGSIWVGVTNASFNNLLKTNSNSLPSGSYVLTEDVDIGSVKIRINSGSSVNICLNGHKLTSTARMFNTFGTLNICDCHAADQEGSMISALNVSETAKNYAPILYGYYGSVTNLYGGNLVATGKVTAAGVIAVSHDGSDKTQPAAIFNMYGGTVSGGNTYKEGASIVLWNKASFNMCGGTVYGGTSGAHSGSVYVSTGCTMNMYGGTITGGTATTYGGNIANSGTFNMYGGTISDGTAGTHSGNMYNSGTITVYGGVITGGTATTNGGNIYNYKTMTIHDALISGGTANGGKGGNIYTPGGKLTMYGGTVTAGKAPVQLGENGAAVYNTGVGGGIYINEGGTYISGNTVIDGNENGNLFMRGFAQLDIEKLGSNAKIGLSGDTHGFISNEAANLSYLHSDQEGYGLCAVNGKVVMGKAGHTPNVDGNISTFSVGYAMTNIMPTETGLTMSSWGNPNGRKTDGTVGYELYATTIAMTDEQNNTVLMITLDLQGPSDTFHKNFRSKISAATGVPAEQIYISATHTHNCPSLTTSSNGNARYLYMLTDLLIQSALDAMADRAPATMQTGSFDTQGLNWSRHYYYIDENGEKVYFGDQFGPRPSSAILKVSKHVRDGDPTMHMMAFNRTGKQPVLVVNWRAHPHRSGGNEKYSVDADVIGATRDYMHNNTDYLFAYFQGAAGNMNTTSRLPNETYKSGKIKEFGDEMGRQIVTNGLPQLKNAETGLIRTKNIIYTANVDHTQDDKYEDAVALRDYYYAYPDLMDEYDEQIAKAKEFGFTSVFHATRLIAKYNLPETKDLELNIFSIGDSVGFYTAPAELWDSFSEETEQLSPFDTTFCIGYCNGSVAYIPYKLDYYVSYEYFYCLFTQDETIDQMQDYYLQHLQEQYDNAQN